MELLNKKFSEELKACLEKKYKRKIKNAEFATFYNLQFDRSITSETARKWLLGESVPNVHTINDLANWLKMDLSELFKI
jgi:transcriptional regulator with XRE-family HTH domain